MSVYPSDLRFYGSANMPDADGATSGGAVAFTKKVSFADMAANGLLDWLSNSASDGAGTTITVSGRAADGTIVTEAHTMNGTTKVAGSTTFERLLKGVASGTGAVGDMAVLSHTAVISAHTCQAGSALKTGTTPTLFKMQSGDKASTSVGDIIHITNNSPAGVQFGLYEVISVDAAWGTDMVAINQDYLGSTLPTTATTYDTHKGMLFEKAPNTITEVRRPFYNVASDVPGGSTLTFYEKIFAVNTNSATTLTGAVISKQADPSSGTFQFSLANALNDTSTITNRQTAPASNTAYTSGAAPQSINVPSPQNLVYGNAAAQAQAIWLQLVLTAGLAPSKTFETMRIQGNTT